MARKQKWLREYLADQEISLPEGVEAPEGVGRLSERKFKQMMAANTKTLPTKLSFAELNAVRVLTGEMEDPAECIDLEDAEEIIEAMGKFEPGTRTPAFHNSPGYKSQLELEREWVKSPSTEAVKTLFLIALDHVESRFE